MTETKHDSANKECGLNIKFPNGISDIADRYAYDSLCSCHIEIPAQERCSHGFNQPNCWCFDAPEAVSAPTVEEGETMREKFKAIVHYKDGLFNTKSGWRIIADPEVVIAFIESEIALAHADERKKFLTEEIEKLPRTSLGIFNEDAGYNACLNKIESRLQAELKALTESI